jgi:hypothetical protein
MHPNCKRIIKRTVACATVLGLSKGVDVEEIHVWFVNALISRYGWIVHNRLTGTVSGRRQIPEGLLLRLSHGNIGDVAVSGRLIGWLPLDIKP